MKQKKINAYILRVSDNGIQYRGYVQEIENTLEAKQKLVGGTIQVISITPEIDAVLNDEGKLIGLPVNRLWIDENDNPLDIFVGNVICVRHKDDEFISIKPEDKEIIERVLIPIKYICEVPREDGIKQRIICMRPEAEMPEYSE